MSRTNRALMITDSNQACITKMSGCGVQEATWYCKPLGCLKNRRAHSPRISMGYPRDRRFLLKRFGVIQFPFFVDASPQKMSSEDFTPESAETL